MRISRRKILFFVIITFLTVGNSILLVLSLQLFPVYGGYSRQIFFIRPNQNSNSDGYFIIVDELAPRSQNYNIDWLLHSRGDLNVSEDSQSLIYTVQSYTSDDNVSLKASFLEDISGITESMGVFCPVGFREGRNYPDVYTSYIKARYSGKENPIMTTVLYPKNDSNSNQKFPKITKLPSRLRKIGDYDYIYYDTHHREVEFINPNIKFNGELFFLRQNSSASYKTEYLYIQNGNLFELENLEIFSSSNLLNNMIITYSNISQISGHIDGKTSQISIYCPFSVLSVRLDGNDIPFSYSDSVVTFSLDEPSAFVISSSNDFFNPEKDDLMTLTSVPSKPIKEDWAFDESIFEGLQHPYILFDQLELKDLRIKINDNSKPWKGWYEEYISKNPNINHILSNDLTYYEDDQRYHIVYKLALKFALDNNISCFNKLKEYLLDMGSITHYSQDLRMAHNVQAYAVAFDIIYNNLTLIEQDIIYELLYEHAIPLMRMDLYHANNHRVVDAGALGMAGLALKNKDMIDLAISTALDYFYDQNPADGGSFEGYSYIAYAIIEMSQFAIGLRRLNSFDFYEDSKFSSSLGFTAETLSPLGMPGSFEDCSFNPRIQEMLIIAAAQIHPTDPILAQNFQWIWEQRQNNSYLPSSSIYGYLKGDPPSFQRILCYNVNDKIKATQYKTRKEIWKESSMAFLRSGDLNGLFMPFSCKNYDQNHPHQDENSFELWAYGAYILNNPGYPGWGKPYHTWSQSTEGANSLLIGGAEQIQVVADGLSSSLTSPYFSMVKGVATEIYNDAGSYLYNPAFYSVIISVFSLLGLCVLFFYMISKSEHVKEIPEKRSVDIQDRLTRSKLIQNTFIHPYKTIRYLSESKSREKDVKYLNRIVYLLLSGIMAIVFLISCFDVNNTVIYHSQYHEDKYNFVFDLLPIVILVLFTLGTLIVMLLIFSLVKIYSGSNRLLTFLELQKSQTQLTKKHIKGISTLSFAWMAPILIIFGILIISITVQDLKGAIHGLWTELNSISDVYELLVSVFNNVIIVFGVTFLIGIPFFVLIIDIFGYGINYNTRFLITKKKGRKISLIGILLVIITVFFLYITFYIIFKSLFSLITIEAIVS